jgi:hypothetical protein
MIGCTSDWDEPSALGDFGSQFIHLGDDAFLLGEGWERE